MIARLPIRLLNRGRTGPEIRAESSRPTGTELQVRAQPGRQVQVLSSFRDRADTSKRTGRFDRLLWIGAIGGALLLGAIVAALLSSEPVEDFLRFIGAVIVYGAPLAGLAVWFALRPVARIVPVLPDAEQFDHADATDLVTRLVADRNRLNAERADHYREGLERGIPLTKSSGSKLFSRRYQEGRDANISIMRIDDEVSRIDDKVREVRTCIGLTLPDWAASIRPWVVNFSIATSLQCAAVVFVIAFLVVGVLEICDALPAGLLAWCQTVLWFPAVPISPAPILAGCLSAILAAAISLIVLLRRLPTAVGGRNVIAWRSLEAKWSAGTDPRSFFWSDGQAWAALSLRAPGADAPEEAEPWYHVLSVLPRASKDQIRAAYRQAINSYHPDRVAGLGIKIREVAERESKRINTAYRDAMQSRTTRRRAITDQSAKS